MMLITSIAQESSGISPDILVGMTVDDLKKCIEESAGSNNFLCDSELESRDISAIELASIYREIGICFYENQSSDLSALYFKKAVRVLKRSNDNSLLLCDIHMKLGNALLQGWRNQEALDAYQSVLDMAIEKRDKDNLFKAQSTRAIVLKRMNQLDKALLECKESLALIDQTSYKNKRNHVNVLTIISEIYLDLNKYDSVLHYVNQGIHLSKNLRYHKAVADLYIKKGWSYYKKNDTIQALEYLQVVEKIIAKEKISNNSNQAIKLNYYLATYFFDVKSYKQAIEYLLKTINSVQEKDLRKDKVIETKLLLANSYKEIGDAKASNYWFSDYEKLRAVFQKRKDRTTNKIHYENDQRLGDEIKKLQKERIEEQRYKLYALLVLGCITILLIFSVWKYIGKQNSNKKVFEELIQKISVLESKEQKIKQRDQIKEISIDDEKINTVLKGLDRLERQEYFLNSDCNLRSMAKKVKTNATYLSKIIKTHKKESFNDYINRLRIEYVLKRLKNDRKFRSFSIKSIAQEIGYKSDNSFAKHFKLKTGLNPSYYIKNIEKLVS